MTKKRIPDNHNDYWVCPIYGLRSRKKNIIFNNGFEIKLASEELKEYLSEYYLDLPIADDADFVLTTKITEEATLRQEVLIAEGFKIGQAFTDIITGLRICHSGSIFLGPLLSTSKPPDYPNTIMDYNAFGIEPISSGFSIFSFYNTHWYKTVDKDERKHRYVLTNQEAINAVKIILSIKKFTNDLGIALERFNLSYSEDTSDRLIDQMIGLESLYMSDDKELKYKLALRAAFFIGDEDSRETIFDNIKLAYDIRSSIVHGSRSKKLDKLDEITPTLEEYLRQSILRISILLAKENSLSTIKEKLLDKNIFASGKLLQ